MNLADLLKKLDKFRSWRLERISPTTSPGDITLRLKGVAKEELTSIAEAIKSGKCYRCRIGRGRFFFGSSQEFVITKALEFEMAKGKKK